MEPKAQGLWGWQEAPCHSPAWHHSRTHVPSAFVAFTWLSLFFQIFYRVVSDIEPGEELLLFMKSEDYSHETMAPDIHG